jgi:two-component system, NtrC family, response regulator AtoC
MPLLLQGKILRLVQEKQFERVGGLQTLSVDVRVVAATNRDLRALVEQKLFREDLFFRLSVMEIEIPPLRKRRRDVPLLADAFLQRLAREMGRKELRLSEEAKRALAAHSWPGNVRELQNCLERAAILCDGPTIEPAHLRLDPGPRAGPGLGDVLDLSGPLAEVRERAAERAEEEAIALALRATDGDRAAAAAQLGVSLSTLNRRLRPSPDGADGA